ITGSCIQLGDQDLSSNGVAEELVTRNRFYNCSTAIALYNYNTLDIYIWHNYFENNTTGIYHATGGFQAYDNRFVGSTNADFHLGSGVVPSIVNNVSLNSASFYNGSGGPYLQGNRIYGSTGVPLNLASSNPVVMIDNLVAGASGSLRSLTAGSH